MLIKHIELDGNKRLYIQAVKGGYNVGIADVTEYAIVRLKEKILDIEEAIEKFEYFYEKLK